MTPRPMDFRGPIKITLKSEQQLLLYKQRVDNIITLEQHSYSNRVFCKLIGLFCEGGLPKDGPSPTPPVLRM